MNNNKLKKKDKNILTVYIFSLSFSAVDLGGRGLFFVDGVSVMGVRCMSAFPLPFFSSSSVHKSCTSSSSICSWQAKNNNKKLLLHCYSMCIHTKPEF